LSFGYKFNQTAAILTGLGTFLVILWYVNNTTMKQIFTLLTISVLMTASTVFSSIDEVIAAMKTGNAAEVARFFDNTVEINMPDKSNSYSKSQAQLVLKDFFSSNGVKSFTVIHKGENSGSQFCIGTLVTKNASYRTTIFMKQKGDKQVLQGITFE
jgi:hypothetical protein